VADVENVIIVGSGPAGYTAALYTARANLRPLVIEGFFWGGLLQQTTEVENYPGFPAGGIQGPELMQKMRDQAEDFGTRFITDLATKVELSNEPGGIHKVWVGDDEYQARTVILSMGAEHKKLGIPGEEELSGAGVSYCATCDAAFFKERDTIIVGGGDSAMEEALFLTRFGSRVTLVHRRDEFRASQIMLDRVRANDKVEIITNAIVDEVLGDEKVTGVRLRSTVNPDETWEIEAGGLFVAIGHDPTTKLFVDQLDHDENGYLVTKPGSTQTNIEGVFAAGDVQDHTYRQAITAAGSGCMAALDAERYLAEREGHLMAAESAPRV
jgi:thioredoxin reductase (NADPH)